MGKTDSSSVSNTTDYTTTSTTNTANSFNTTSSVMQSLSNLGNVTIGDTSGNASSPVNMAIVIGGVVVIAAIIFIFKK